MKFHHFVHKMKKNTPKDGLDAKKDAKIDAKSSFCCSVRKNVVRNHNIWKDRGRLHHDHATHQIKYYS